MALVADSKTIMTTLTTCNVSDSSGVLSGRWNIKGVSLEPKYSRTRVYITWNKQRSLYLYTDTTTCINKANKLTSSHSCIYEYVLRGSFIFDFKLSIADFF